MRSVNLEDSIEDLWIQLKSPLDSESPNRVIAVIEDRELVGIITDGDIRKFLALHGTAPSQISQVINRDFICLEFNSSRIAMAEELNRKLLAKDWSIAAPIHEVIVRFGESEFRVESISNFTSELNNLRDEYVVIGLGFVGLTLLAVLSQKVSNVLGVEKNLERLKKLRDRHYYVNEPGLDSYLKNFNPDNFLNTIKEIRSSKRRVNRRIYIVAVNTPLNDDGKVDISDLEGLWIEIANDLMKNDIVILRSTVPFGTSNYFVSGLERITGWTCGVDFYLGYAPERTVEGDAIRELQSLPQILGGYSSACLTRVHAVVENWAPNIQITTSVGAAEMIKLANNSYRDYHFAFANELAQICQIFQVDVNEVISIANQGYSRSSIPKPSPGVGGPCLTKDSHLLFNPIFSTTEGLQLNKSDSAILRARAINEIMPKKSAQKFHRDLQNLSPDTRQILFLGLAFKGLPETNDLRNSPAMELYDYFRKEGYVVSGWDAVASVGELKDAGINTICHDVKSNVAIVLGNNNPGNLEELLRVQEISKIVSIFDPWDLIKQYSQTAGLLEKGIAISSLTTLQIGQ